MTGEKRRENPLSLPPLSSSPRRQSEGGGSVSRVQSSSKLPSLLSLSISHPSCTSTNSHFDVNSVSSATRRSEKHRIDVLEERWATDATEVKIYLIQLDEARDACAQAGLFSKAQGCVDRMHKVLQLYAERLRGEADTALARCQNYLLHRQKLERVELRQEWRSKRSQNSKEQRQIFHSMQLRQHLRLCTEDKRVRHQLHIPHAPQWSAEVMHLEEDLQKYIHQRRYREAKRARAVLEQKKKIELGGQILNSEVAHQTALRSFQAKMNGELQDLSSCHLKARELFLVAEESAFQKLRKQQERDVVQVRERYRLFLHRLERFMLDYRHSELINPKQTGIHLTTLSRSLNFLRG